MGTGPAGYAREVIARQIGISEGMSEGDEIRREISKLAARLAALERERTAAGTITAAADRDRQRLDKQQPPSASRPRSQRKGRGT